MRLFLVSELALIVRLRKGRTVVTVAHRMRDVQAADQIVILDRGHIVEKGTHTELMQLNCRYADHGKISDPVEATQQRGTRMTYGPFAFAHSSDWSAGPHQSDAIVFMSQAALHSTEYWPLKLG